jgi:P27 family predicted phage terminase small subunit
MPGRRPSALKLLEGTYRPDRSRREPRPPAGIPEAPAWLCEQAREIWRELAPALAGMGVLALPDRQALALACDALAEHRAARAVVEREGATYPATTESGATLHRVRPEVGIAADAWRRALRGLSEFGLTPASRGRIDVEPGDAGRHDPVDEFFRD